MIDFPEQVSRDDILMTLRDLRRTNRWLGGGRACLRPLRRLVEEVPSHKPGIPVTLLDFGSGSADIPARLVHWGREQGHAVRAVAVDFNFLVCQSARDQVGELSEISVLQGDVQDPPFKDGSCDLILCSAFLHHFSDEEIVCILRRFKKLARQAIVISDLHRHPVAYAIIRLLTVLFSRCAAVRHDGPLSVLRGFRRREIDKILREAGMQRAEVEWHWSFRYVIVIPTSRAV